MRGIIILEPSGAGKSTLGKCIADEIGRILMNIYGGKRYTIYYYVFQGGKNKKTYGNNTDRTEICYGWVRNFKCSN